jgi:hypothetical protein
MEVIPFVDDGSQDTKMNLMFPQLYFLRDRVVETSGSVYREENRVVETSGCLIAAQHWTENQIILDSGANASVFKNQNLIWKIRTSLSC